MFSVCVLQPSEEQKTLLEGPMGNIDALKAADFLAKQDYIDQWICHWLQQTNTCSADDLPLCVEYSIKCNVRLQRIYKLYLRHGILRNDIEYLRQHYIVPLGPWHWNYVDLFQTTNEIITFLWEICPSTFKLGTFIVEARQYFLWQMFVELFDPSDCLDYAVNQQWVMGTKHCIQQGAIVEKKHVKSAFANEDIFSALTQFDVQPDAELWEHFNFYRKIGNQNMAAEEWFWINGFK